MLSDVNLWPLIGVAIIIVGFVLRFNPMLVVIVTAVGTALAAGFPIDKILATIGTGFIKTRNLPLIILLPLAVIGLLERHGLRQHAQNWISSIKSATAGRLLIVYLAARQLTAAIGLTSLGGHPQTVRPLLAPMADVAITTVTLLSRRIRVASAKAQAKVGELAAAVEDAPDGLKAALRKLGRAVLSQPPENERR